MIGGRDSGNNEGFINIDAAINGVNNLEHKLILSFGGMVVAQTLTAYPPLTRELRINLRGLATLNCA
ncbi:MAG: hypothetical protein STSR0004_10600 [Peptococcaceae bacterium]